MVVEQMARCAWNARPDERGLCGRMAWNPHAVHRFGNLTLLTQPLNSSISNGPFADTIGVEGEQVLGKRSRLGQSALLLNTYFHQAALATWDDLAIENRAKALLKAALLVWPKPVDGIASPVAVASAISSSTDRDV